MSRHGRPVLLVEDSQDDAEFTIRALRQAGIVGVIDHMHDGEEALEYLLGSSGATRRALPLFVLLDIKVPKVDGLEVLARIRLEPRIRALPTVILSSSDVIQDIERAYALGANSYVRKPVDFAEYSAVLQQVGRYWTRVNTVVP